MHTEKADSVSHDMNRKMAMRKQTNRTARSIIAAATRAHIDLRQLNRALRGVDPADVHREARHLFHAALRGAALAA